MSFSFWKWPAMMREPFANDSTPRYAVNSCGNFPNNRRRKSSKFSMFALPNFAQQQTLQSRHALAIIRAHLREQPMRLPAATCATVADGRRPIRAVAGPRRGAGHELSLLENDLGAQKLRI